MARAPSGLFRALSEALSELGQVDRSSVGMFLPAPRGEAAHASSLYNRGANRSDVYGETGLIRDYGRDADLGGARWMREISDADARLGPMVENITEDNWFQFPYGKSRGGVLSDVFEHPELYRLEPGLQDLRIRLTDGANYYAHDPRVPRDIGSQHMGLDFRVAPGKGYEPIELPLHEGQHGVDVLSGGYLAGIQNDNFNAGQVQRWLTKERARLSKAARGADDAYWSLDKDDPARGGAKIARDAMEAELKRFDAMDDEARKAFAVESLYRADPREDIARRVQRRRGLSQAQIDSGNFPPWLDTDVPEVDLRISPNREATLGDLIRTHDPAYIDPLETPSSAELRRMLEIDPRMQARTEQIRRLINFLGYGSAAGGLGLSMGATREALLQQLEGEAA